MPILEVSGLSKAFGGVQAVHDVSFSLEAGELLALIGPNGAGKTTCFNCLNGQLRPDAGSVRLAGRELVGLPPRAVWRHGVGRTFQITQTFASMTVLENVQQALLARHRRTRSLWPAAGALYRAEAEALLERVEMADQAARPCAVLAYGDLKRVELAIALAQEPVLLLLDEPTAGMAPRERVALMALTRSIVRAQGLAVLFTEHDMDVVFGHADRIMVMNRGALVALGTPDAVRADPLVQEIYLGAGNPAPAGRTAMPAARQA
jgi:branched-chain amino acid transport system ATP-binding protein